MIQTAADTQELCAARLVRIRTYERLDVALQKADTLNDILRTVNLVMRFMAAPHPRLDASPHSPAVAGGSVPGISPERSDASAPIPDAPAVPPSTPASGSAVPRVSTPPPQPPPRTLADHPAETPPESHPRPSAPPSIAPAQTEPAAAAPLPASSPPAQPPFT